MTDDSTVDIQHRRLDGLDALRGIAALAVVLFHYANRGPHLYPELGQANPVARYGQYGVHLFFVISGFVIFMTLERSTPRRFLITRFIRLYPIYWFCVLITAGVVVLAGLPGRETSAGVTAVNMTMLQGFLRVPAVDGAYWTLAAELSFYAQVGILYFTGALRGRLLLPVLYLWVAVMTAITVVGSRLAGPWRVLDAFPGIVWMPIFIAGIAISRAWSGDRRPAVMALPMVCAAVAAATQGIEVGVVSLVAVALVAITLFIQEATRWRIPRLLSFLGIVSYPLYLIHQNVGYVLLRALDRAGIEQVLATGISLVAILCVATVLTVKVDVPLRGWLRVRLMSRATGVATQLEPAKQSPR